jgi:aminoglycoside phosphotransferase (APT) family kinase protein
VWRPGVRVAGLEPLTGGLTNSNYRVHLAGGGGSVVLRIFERDPAACAREAAVLGLVGATVPVPRVLHAEPDGHDGGPPFMVMELVEGITFRELRRTADDAAVAEAAFSVGQALAGIAAHRFPRAGTFDSELDLGPWYVDGPSPIPRLVDLLLSSPNLRRRMNGALADRMHALAWGWAGRLAELDGDPRLVHADLSSTNVLVRCVDGRWRVAGVIDWELAFAGSPMWDVGSFVRYDRRARPRLEPHFSRGCREGGLELPAGWRALARMVDLASLLDALTHDPLPESVSAELVELVRATVDDRDPVL